MLILCKYYIWFIYVFIWIWFTSNYDAFIWEKINNDTLEYSWVKCYTTMIILCACRIKSNRTELLQPPVFLISLLILVMMLEMSTKDSFNELNDYLVRLGKPEVNLPRVQDAAGYVYAIFRVAEVIREHCYPAIFILLLERVWLRRRLNCPTKKRLSSRAHVHW